MDRPPSRPRPRGFLGMVALVLLIEGIVGGRDDLLDHGSLEWRFGDRAARRKTAGASVLCLGGSQLRFGVAATELESRLQRPVRNLALTGSPPPVSYFLLRHALNSGARPDTLLVDFSPFLLVREPRAVAGRLPEVTTLRDVLDLAWTTHDSGLGAELLMAHVFPSSASRRRLRTCWDDPGPGRPTAYDAAARRARWSPGGDARIGEVVYPGRWICPESSLDYVHRLLRLAQRRGIAVVWIMTPSDPAILAERERRGLEDAYDRFAVALQADHPELRILDGRRLAYPESLFTDPVHLNRLGATAFTGEIASALTARPIEPWVRLGARPATAVASGPALPSRR